MEQRIDIEELVDMVYSVATKTEEKVAKKVMSLLIAGFKTLTERSTVRGRPYQNPLDKRPQRSNKTGSITVSGEMTTAVKKTTTRKRRQKRSTWTRWSDTELSILRSKNLSRSAKIAELRKVGRTPSAVKAKAVSLGVSL